MRNILLTISYDGTNYCGWQVQPNGTSIASELNKAVFAVTGETVSVTGSGRTDAGVHALAQTATVSLATKISMDKLPLALNSRLPADISVLKAVQVPDGFHARFDCIQKRYFYLIENARVASPLLKNRVCHIKKTLNVEAMQEAARLLFGTHDFAAFRTTGSSAKTTVRTIRHISLEMESEAGQRAEGSRLIKISAAANGFLYNMVRIIAGTLIAVGEGRLTKDSIAKMLEDGIRLREAVTAPACGLYLEKTEYLLRSEESPGGQDE